MITSEMLSKLYYEYLVFTDEKLSYYSPAVIAGVMISQALSLYKTILSPEEFESILEKISESGDDVKRILSKPTIQ
jgi:hypothetical protein